MQKILWILDAGHGANTPGKRSPKFSDGTRLMEYEFTRDIVHRIAVKCQCLGIPYHILVPEQTDISLSERCNRANRLVAPSDHMKALVSVHGNAAGNGEDWHSATGFEVFTTPGLTKADRIATEVFNQVRKVYPNWKYRMDTQDGDPDKEENFYILKHTSCPAILTENGFYTNEAEAKMMMTPEFRDMIAEAHVQAFLALRSQF